MQQRIIPERTFVTGLCTFHKQYDNIIRMDGSTGLLYFTDDVKHCFSCKPQFERGIVFSSSSIDSFVTRMLPYDEQGPVDDGFGWPRETIPKPVVVKKPRRCESCSIVILNEKNVICDVCSTCVHCSSTQNVIIGICKMCLYYESLHQANIPHNFSKCSFCAGSETRKLEALPSRAAEMNPEAPVFVPVVAHSHCCLNFREKNL